VDNGAERGGGRVQGQSGTIGALEFHGQVAVARQRGGAWNFDKARDGGRCGRRMLDRDTLVQICDFDSKLLGHP
jgi:hypothetical protein